MIEINENYKKIIQNAREYFLSGESKNLDFRKKSLLKLKNTILKYETQILDALKKDLGKNNFEAYISEIAFVLKEIDFQIKNLNKFAKTEKVKTQIINQIGKSYIYKEAFGVVLIISPWNYPFQLLISPLIGAISAGNCVILKPSEISENTSKILKLIIEETFEKKYISLFEGGAEETSKILENKFDYIFYTGSTNVGKIIMEKAAKNLSPVTLELGGKSPTIVDKSADLKISAKRIIWAKLFNCGQTCVAPDYLLIDSRIKEKFIEILKKQIKEFYGENILENENYGKIINIKHFNRLKNYLDGANIICGAKTNAEKLFIEPTLIEANWEDKIMQEEIFGPILPIISFDNIDEIIAKINSLPKSLAIYVYSKDKIIQDKFIYQTSSGGICINDSLSHVASNYLAFGGVGDSGMGSYHGKYSFMTFSHKKSILIKSFLLDLKFKYPPYKISINKIKAILKFL